MSTQTQKNEIRITRIYDAPVKAVWDAWADPKQAAQWWGPRGFTITTHSKDLRAGGSWVYTMHGPDGTDYPNHTKYYEVEKHSRLVYDHGGNENQPPMFRVTVEFKEVKGKTEMMMVMSLPTPEALVQTKKIIKSANGNSTWDRLSEFLTKESSQHEVFVINRTFDAPIETIFEMWTNPAHLSKWLAPGGGEMKFLRSEIQPGKSSFYVMGVGNTKMYGRAEYLEILKPHRLVYTQQFCDENEKVTRHPMAPTWPETMLTQVTFASEGPELTRVTVQWQPHGKVTLEELATFVNAKGGMTQGWTGSFDQLEAYLAQAK